MTSKPVSHTDPLYRTLSTSGSDKLSDLVRAKAAQVKDSKPTTAASVKKTESAADDKTKALKAAYKELYDYIKNKFSDRIGNGHARPPSEEELIDAVKKFVAKDDTRFNSQSKQKSVAKNGTFNSLSAQANAMAAVWDYAKKEYGEGNPITDEFIHTLGNTATRLQGVSGMYNTWMLEVLGFGDDDDDADDKPPKLDTQW